MKITYLYRLTALLVLTNVLLLTACSKSSEADHAYEREHGHESEGAHDEVEKGPHRGRLLKDGATIVELAIFEDGVPPEFHAWITVDGKAIPPEQAQLDVRLERLGNAVDVIAFKPQQDFLRGQSEVVEPHSFRVTVTAQVNGKPHTWAYDNFEGRVVIAAESAREAGIVVEPAGPRLIRDVLPLYGAIVVNPEASRSVTARFPGPIKTVHKSLGDAVKQGEVLATVESNESLQTYSVLAPVSGVITQRAANPGEVASSQPLFQITNMASVLAELSVFPKDLQRIRVGQRVRITALDGSRTGEAEIIRLAPAGVANNQSLKAWARIVKPTEWTPGEYVNAEVLIGGAQVPLAVKRTGLQSFRDFTVVFARVDDTYEVRMLELGRSDGEYVEVLGGLTSGAEYVTANSYLIKADIEKSGASHDH
jgi:membrane fusion protein, heavy metal efflux system